MTGLELLPGRRTCDPEPDPVSGAPFKGRSIQRSEVCYDRVIHGTDDLLTLFCDMNRLRWNGSRGHVVPEAVRTGEDPIIDADALKVHIVVRVRG